MNFSYIFLIAFLGTIQTFFGQDQKEYILIGSINSVDQDYVYLRYGDHIDSTKIKDNHFTFTGKLEHPYTADVFTKNTKGTGFYLVGGKTLVKVIIYEKIKSAQIEVVEGSILDITNDLHNFLDKNSKKVSFKQLLFQKMDSLIQTNPQHPFFGELLESFASENNFSPAQINDLKSRLDQSAQDIKIMQQIDVVLERMDRFKVGDKIVDFEFPNSNGQPVDTKDFRGKVVLIDFWYTGCAGCYESFPKLLTVYNQFKNKNFEIIAVALQERADLWKRDIARFQLSWINLKAKPMGENPSLKFYELYYAPTNFLIDESGKILATNISAEDLNQKLAGLLD